MGRLVYGRLWKGFGSFTIRANGRRVVCEDFVIVRCAKGLRGECYLTNAKTICVKQFGWKCTLYNTQRDWKSGHLDALYKRRSTGLFVDGH